MSSAAATVGTPGRAAPARRLARATAVVISAVAALVVWVIADPLLGVNLTVVREGVTTTIGAGMVLLMATVSALLGWALLALLERFIARPRAWRIWLGVAIAVLALSLVMPFNSGEIDGSAQVALLVMHLAVGVPLMALLGRTAGD
ncbi:DUF6069 family protein [Kribbella deserti]|uniref:DUF6069 family protein n=1 Tax=Kribbella deserti TaxID=1926257 RepID=A0ABV6QRW7_9ACTN